MLISLKKGMANKQTESAKKSLCKKQKLCYSIEEAKRLFGLELTRPTPTGANGRNMLCKQGFHPRWREITQEELSANMYGGRKIDLVGVAARNGAEHPYCEAKSCAAGTDRSE